MLLLGGIMTKDENIHAGHRERLLETVYNVGLNNLSQVQIMEFILFYIFPRGDTNPLAHRLLNKFKNISTVLDASLDDIKSVKGMGDASAKKLKMLLEIFNVYTFNKTTKQEGISTFGDVCDHIESLLRYKTNEEMHAIGLNSNGKYIGERCLAKGGSSLVGISIRDVSNFVVTYNAQQVYLVHNHPGGSCMPSKQDIDSNRELQKKFEFTGCSLVDNLVIGDDGIYSMRTRSLVRIFSENDKFREVEELLNLNKKEPKE